MSMLKLQNVSKKFGGLTALEPLDLEIDAQQTFLLLGPSGCGKSTLLKLALGLVRSDSGSVQFDGQTLHPGNIRQIRQRIGYVIQDGGLFPHLTARQNVTLVADYLGWPSARIDSRIQELAELTQLPVERLARYPTQLSGGQQQRIGLMRALFLDPDLLLLDEPLGSLDPVIRRDLQTDLRSIFRRLDKTVVMVSHDLHEAAWFGGDILLFREGRLVQRGSIAELLESPADPFVTRFVSAQRNSLTEGLS